MAQPSPQSPSPAGNAGGCPVDHAALAAARGCPVSPRAAEFDPFGDGYQQDPPEYVRWAREQEPVFYSPKLGYWVVTRYDDIKAVFRDNHTFSPSIALEKITPTGPEANAVLESYGYAMNRTLVNEDEPAHMPRRRVLMDPFTPEELKHHEPMVRRLTRAYVDRFIDDGRADLVDQMLWEVPLTVALHFLGVPEEDMDLLRQYSIAHTVNTWGRPKPEEQVAVAHAVGNFWQLAGKILDTSDYAYGFDAQEGGYKDLLKAGIIDPTKVVRCALQDAASVAGLLITTEAMVAEKPEKKAPMAGPPGGDMGGMGGMDF